MQKTPLNAEKANCDGRTDQPTDQSIDRLTDIAGYRVACTRLRMVVLLRTHVQLNPALKDQKTSFVTDGTLFLPTKEIKEKLLKGP